MVVMMFVVMTMAVAMMVMMVTVVMVMMPEMDMRGPYLAMLVNMPEHVVMVVADDPRAVNVKRLAGGRTADDERKRGRRGKQ